MSIRSRVDRLDRVAGLLKQQQSRSAGAQPWWRGIDIAQRRMIAALSDDELRALHATVVAFQAGLELMPEQEALALRCEEAIEQERQRECDSTTSPSRGRIT
jgi:hypothetical protein